MNQKLIFLPLIGQVLITFLVWLWLVVGRVTTIKRQNIDPQILANEVRSNEIFRKLTNQSDNLENLFELPVLFFTVIVVLFLTKNVDSIFVMLCWAFVATRGVHSWIHCTGNRILHRFYAYLISSAILWMTWARLAIHLIQ